VPVLDHDGVLIHESSVISEYLDGLSAHNRLLPTDAVAQARTRIWGLNTLEYHDSVNTLTFSSYQRQMLLAKSPEELQARWDAMPDKIRVRKTLDPDGAWRAVRLCAGGAVTAAAHVRRDGGVAGLA
jgi:glutathione S-transferase